jgi:hypothetical protein
MLFLITHCYCIEVSWASLLPHLFIHYSSWVWYGLPSFLRFPSNFLYASGQIAVWWYCFGDVGLGPCSLHFLGVDHHLTKCLKYYSAFFCCHQHLCTTPCHVPHNLTIIIYFCNTHRYLCHGDLLYHARVRILKTNHCTLHLLTLFVVEYFGSWIKYQNNIIGSLWLRVFVVT